jgi:hypothetical protein
VNRSKLIDLILSGKSDNNIPFSATCKMKTMSECTEAVVLIAKLNRGTGVGDVGAMAKSAAGKFILLPVQ